MVAVINFGGQFAHLIARRVRELGVKSELFSPDVSIATLNQLKTQAIILSGSPYSVYEKDSPKPNSKIYDLQIPILGICYGLQLIANHYNTKVISYEQKQFGKETIKTKPSLLFSGLNREEKVWFSHGDQVNRIPKGFKVIESSKNSKIAGIENYKKKVFGIQFHPEVTHTEKGKIVLSNFLFSLSDKSFLYVSIFESFLVLYVALSDLSFMSRRNLRNESSTSKTTSFFGLLFPFFILYFII